MIMRRILIVLAAVGLSLAGSGPARACCFLFSCFGHHGGYAPQPNYCGYAPYGANYGGAGYSSGTYSNPFAPLVPSPYRYRGFYSGYAPTPYSASYMSNGCSTCGSSNCPTGDCAVSSSRSLNPEPDTPPATNDRPMPTYDQEDLKNKGTVPMDDPNFRKPNQEAGAFPDFDGQRKTFRLPSLGTQSTDTPSDDQSPAVDPLKGTETLKDKSETEKSDETTPDSTTPEIKFSPGPVNPRNSASVPPAAHLDHKITYRSAPVIVRHRDEESASRPLIVRKAVRVTDDLSAATPTPAPRAVVLK